MYQFKYFLLFFVLYFGVFVVAQSNTTPSTKKIIQTKKQDLEVTKQRILNKIKLIYAQNTSIQNSFSSAKIECMLTPAQRKKINIHTNQSIFEYQNILLELKIKKQPSKIAQDLLIKAIREDNNIPSLLLALQLYFLKQCERCERARMLSYFDYYRTDNATITQLLAIEGGNFFQSYVVQAEAFLCNALENEKAQDFFMAYIYFMLSGNHTRALNALLMGISYSNENVLFETFKFLASNDIVIVKNTDGIFLLEALSLQQRGRNFDNLSLLHHFKNLKVLENGASSNYILTLLLLRDMDIGRILSPLHKLANTVTLQEYFEKQQYYENILKTRNLRILERAELKDIQEYYKILAFKQKLKQIPFYPYAITYVFSTK